MTPVALLQRGFVSPKCAMLVGAALRFSKREATEFGPSEFGLQN
jgi:hypothetical protein